ncbi:MAG: hypothetical protein OEY14_16685, partial [Myxococcales bacterium]|nr:hypothetical protein [Myxococcales bacterium]
MTGPLLYAQATLEIYELSPAAALGVSCAECHLPEIEPRPGLDPPRPRHEHRFVGMDPPWGASPSEAAEAAARTRALLARAVSIELDAIVPGTLTVRLRNLCIAHTLPSGLSAIRDVWVELTLERADGSVERLPRLIELGS